MALFDDYNQQISDLIAKRPQYTINPEYADNQDIARSKAYGRNRAFQTQEGNIEQQAADATNEAQQYSSSTSSILNTLSSITGNKNQALRGLGQDESQYQGQALNDVMGTNTAMAEEKDKAWNYNVNEPFQLKLNQLVQKKKAKDQFLSQLLDVGGTIGAFALGGPAGLLAKNALTKKNNSGTDYGFDVG